MLFDIWLTLVLLLFIPSITFYVCLAIGRILPEDKKD
jgi:hypothetical protein